MPAVFRAVRSLSNIDEADYMMSLAGSCMSLLCNIFFATFLLINCSRYHCPLCSYCYYFFFCFLFTGDFNYIEFIANSKSGQFFFYSYDGKYMIKTQTKEECVLLRDIMPQYVEHLSSNPNSLLVRFYGMHRYVHEYTHASFLPSFFPCCS
jgi:hypothetical protein